MKSQNQKYKIAMKMFFSLLAVGLFTCIAHAELWVGNEKQQLDFTITTPGYYAVTLNYFVQPNNYVRQSNLVTMIDRKTESLLSVLLWSKSNGSETGSVTVVRHFDAGAHYVTNDPNQSQNLSSISKWAYTVQTADPNDYSQALTDLQTQLTNVQNSIDGQGASTSAALTDINQKLADIESAIATTQAAIQASIQAGNDDLKQSFSDQIAALQQQLLQAQTASFDAMEKQLAKIQKSIKHLHLSPKNTFIGTIDTPLTFTIAKAGNYNITLSGSIIIGGSAEKGFSSQMTTVIDGTSGQMPSIAAGEAAGNGSMTSMQFLTTGSHTISANIDLWDASGNSVSSDDARWVNTDHSIWSYTVEPAR